VTDPTWPWRRRLFLANGVFLVVVGGVQVMFELLAYYAGVGPYGDKFADSPYVVGWLEAHGLAVIIGVLLLTVAARDDRRFWHVLAAVVHAFLGTANLVFFQGFIAWGMVPAGVAATVVHFVLVVAHTAGFVVSRGTARQP
jgi:hypothetical protein